VKVISGVRRAASMSVSSAWLYRPSLEILEEALGRSRQAMASPGGPTHEVFEKDVEAEGSDAGRSGIEPGQIADVPDEPGAAHRRHQEAGGPEEHVRARRHDQVEAVAPGVGERS